MAEFESQMKTFATFVSESNLGAIEPLQYELTYVNHIPQGECWESPSDLSQLLVAFNGKVSSGRFLPGVDGLDWTTTFALPDDNG